MKLLIGSRALAYYQPSFKPHKDSDWDLISDSHVEGTEWHDSSVLNNHLMANYVSGQTTLPNGLLVDVVNPIGLTIIKRSHLWRDMFFDKHITHYHRHLVDYSKQYTNADIELLNNRTELTVEMFKQSAPNLNMTPEQFFSNTVDRKYNHDYLHTLVAFNQMPYYLRMLKDGHSVMCDVEKWNTFTDVEKCQAVAEETMVIAIERFMVPNEWNFYAKQAYYQSLKKVCTTLCSGWFRDYAIDNFPVIMRMFNKQKFEVVQTKLE